MKKLLIAVLAVSGLTLATATSVFAEEKTIKGEGMCAKCELDETKSCQNAVQVKKDGKTVTYYLTHNDVSKEFHRNICKGRKDVTATGKVKETDGKKELTPTKIELTKK
jgi:hypothetical protein